MSSSKIPVMYTCGRCRVCGCTEEQSCDLGAGFHCWWVDAAHTLCSRPQCLAVVPLREIDNDLVPAGDDDEVDGANA